MSNTNGSEQEESLNRQIEFLKEAFGMSDSEAEERVQEAEDLDIIAGDKTDQDGLRQVLDSLMGKGEELDEQLSDEEDDSGFEATDPEAGTEAPSDKEIERIETEDLDVETVNGKEVVSADQLYSWIVEMEANLAELSERLKMQENSAQQLSDRQTQSPGSEQFEQDEKLLKGLVIGLYICGDSLNAIGNVLNEQPSEIAETIRENAKDETQGRETLKSLSQIADDLVDDERLREYEEEVRQNTAAKQVFDEADDIDYLTSE